jgi:hypothetical protein
MKKLIRPHGKWCGCPPIEEDSYPRSLGCPSPSKPLTVIDTSTQREMKTPMQEHIEWMQEKLHILVEYRNMDLANEVDECIQHAESMLKKEQAVIIESFHEGMRCHMFDPSTGIAEEYYNVKFIESNK